MATISKPTSSRVMSYVELLAPSIVRQSDRLESQRRHSYVKRAGLFVHEPSDVRTVLPSCIVPETDGGVTFFGGGNGAGRGATAAEATDVADAEPPPLDAVTVTRGVFPTSAEASVYWAEVAPAIGSHAPLEESQRFHS